MDGETSCAGIDLDKAYVGDADGSCIPTASFRLMLSEQTLVLGVRHGSREISCCNQQSAKHLARILCQCHPLHNSSIASGLLERQSVAVSSY